MAKRTISKGRRIGLVFASISLALFGLFFVSWSGASVYVFYRDGTYYQSRSKFRPFLESNEPFSPEGLAYDGERDLLLMSGKMDNPRLPSRVYFQKGNLLSNHCSLFQNQAKPILSSLTGLATFQDDLYVAYDGHIGCFDLSSAAQSKEAIETKTFASSLSAYSLATDGISLFVGECWKEGSSFRPHLRTNNDGKETHALGVVYSLSNGKAKAAFALPDNTHGFLRTSTGEVVISVRNSAWSTEYQKYQIGEREADGVFVEQGENAPLYDLDSRSLVSSFSGPSNGGDIEALDDHVLTFSAGDGPHRFRNALMGYQSIDCLKL